MNDTTSVAVEHRLSPLLAPRSMALVGASTRPDSVGNQMVKELLLCGFKGPIYPVNPKYETVEGLTCYPSLADLPGPVDHVVIAVANPRVEAQLSAAALKRNLPFPVLKLGSITHTGLASTDQQLSSRLVSARVIANSGSITKVELVYNDGSGVKRRNMVPSLTGPNMIALLPGHLSPKSLTYHIEAKHSTGPIVRLPATGEFGYSVGKEEVLFFDRAELVVVDHPAGVEIYPDERLMPAPPFPPFRLISARAPRPPVGARDGRGREGCRGGGREQCLRSGRGGPVFRSRWCRRGFVRQSGGFPWYSRTAQFTLALYFTLNTTEKGRIGL